MSCDKTDCALFEKCQIANCVVEEEDYPSYPDSVFNDDYPKH